MKYVKIYLKNKYTAGDDYIVFLKCFMMTLYSKLFYGFQLIIYN